jgi:hypothetical protein
VLVAAMPERLLLYPTADLIHRVVGELHDMERIRHPHRVGQLGGQRA